MLYNNTPNVWASGGLDKVLATSDGHIWHRKGGYVARCKNREEAEAVLRAAGYTQGTGTAAAIWTAPKKGGTK